MLAIILNIAGIGLQVYLIYLLHKSARHTQSEEVSIKITINSDEAMKKLKEIQLACEKTQL